MRVYGYADPRLMNRYDLLREHEDVHLLLRRARHTDREQDRFKGELGVSRLTLRHECIRVALAIRYGLDHHSRDNHRTPVDTDAMSQRAAKALLLYERLALPTGVRRNPAAAQSQFQRLMAAMNFPHADPDTPWGEHDMSIDEYIAQGDAWTRRRPSR